jgi:glycosyltransferase involved in cell wall biosynthesis
LHNTHLTHRVAFYDVGWLRKKLSPWGRSFFVLDRAAREYLESQFGILGQSIEEIHNGVDCSIFRVPTQEERAAARAEFGVGDSDVFVVFVGRLHPSKQPNAIIQAAAQARRELRTKLKFAIIGDGELRRALEAELANEHVETICTMYAWMPPLRAYFAADLVVMPSLYEGFGLVGAEAMATGCPVLRSRTGGCSQMVREGVTGFECDTSVDDFLEKLFAVVARPQRLREMRSSARRWAKDHLDVLKQAERIVAAYRRRLPNGHVSRS